MGDDVNRVFLLPGEYMVSKEPYIISTLLGSCVAVTMHHPKFKFGGMNHFMLPTPSIHSVDTGTKYGNYAINALAQFMEKECGSLQGVEAMIIGGGKVIHNIRPGNDRIGSQNISFAREILRAKNIKVIREHVGGEVGYKVQYHNWNNQLTIKKMGRTELHQALIGQAGNP